MKTLSLIKFVIWGTLVGVIAVLMAFTVLQKA